MSRISKRLLVVVVACLAGAGILWARGHGATTASAAAQQPLEERPVWVGVRVFVPNEKEPDYLIGTMDRRVVEAIEADRFDRRFVRISDLRTEETLDESENVLTHYACEDRYDWGVTLIQYKDVLSLDFKKGDPLLR
jgi:hypothetical protein